MQPALNYLECTCGLTLNVCGSDERRGCTSLDGHADELLDRPQD